MDAKNRGELENSLDVFFDRTLPLSIKYWKSKQVQGLIDSPLSAILGSVYEMSWAIYGILTKNKFTPELIIEFHKWFDEKLPTIKDRIYMELNK